MTPETPSKFFNKPKTSNSSSTVCSDGLGNFIGDFRNDGATGDFDSRNYPHSREMMNVSD